MQEACSKALPERMHCQAGRPTRPCSRPLRARDHWHFGSFLMRLRRLMGNRWVAIINVVPWNSAFQHETVKLDSVPTMIILVCRACDNTYTTTRRACRSAMYDRGVGDALLLHYHHQRRRSMG